MPVASFTCMYKSFCLAHTQAPHASDAGSARAEAALLEVLENAAAAEEGRPEATAAGRRKICVGTSQ
eukprot:1160224-Pelagomonas_calceolata.AAC.5